MQVIPNILYEDNHLLVALKPAGLLTQGDISGEPSLLEIIRSYIKLRDNKPGKVYLGMVQRLDRPVSGVIIFAKTSKAAGRLSSQIRNHQVGKLYTALTCAGNPAVTERARWGEVSNHLLRARDKTKVVPSACRHSQCAVLRMKTVGMNVRNSVHLIALITGRKHQIRSQLAHLGLAVSGDSKYGSQQCYPVQQGIGLHAVCCVFEHPVKREKMKITATVPDDFFRYFSEAETIRIRSAVEKEIKRFSEEHSLVGSPVV